MVIKGKAKAYTRCIMVFYGRIISLSLNGRDICD